MRDFGLHVIVHGAQGVDELHEVGFRGGEVGGTNVGLEFGKEFAGGGVGVGGGEGEGDEGEDGEELHGDSGGEGTIQG